MSEVKPASSPGCLFAYIFLSMQVCYLVTLFNFARISVFYSIGDR
jgi:hypothetical protein